NGCGARSFNGRPLAHADSSEQRRPEGSAFIGGQQLDGLAVYVGLDLPPERAARTAATETDACDRNLKFCEEREGIAEAHRHAFQHCTDKVRPRMRCGDAREGSARLGIEMRRALAEEIRGPQHSFASRRNSRGFRSQLIVRN